MESSALGRFMREAGPWSYAVVNLSHVLGVAALFGSILVLDLRLLGLWRRVPLAALASATVPVGKTGVAVALVTGVLLLATNATEYHRESFPDPEIPRDRHRPDQRVRAQPAAGVEGARRARTYAE